MSSAGNGSGSHFASAKGGRPDRPSASRASSSLSSQDPGDTLQDIYSLPLDAPNGSNATPSSSFEPVSARKASPSDTDIFLAVAAQGSSAAAGYGEQPSLTPASNPVPGPAPTPSAPAGPVNPLVAARSNGAQGAPGSADGLFPIGDVAPTSTGRGFDTSFGESGRKRTVVIAVLVVILLVAAVVGLFFFLRDKEVADAQAKIDEAVELLRDTDAVIVPLDAAIAAEISTGVASDTLSNLMLQSSTTSTNLSNAEQLANEADRSRDILGEDDAAAIDAVKGSVSARRSMLEIGRMLLSTDTAVNGALSDLAMAYGCIADANDRLQSAQSQFDQYNEALANGWDTGGFDLWALVQLDYDAVNAATEAQTWVAAAKEAFPSADLGVLDTYLAARVNQLNLMAQIDTCLANGDFDGAYALNDQYNEADYAQQVAAEQVPAVAAELLTASYAETTASQREAYDVARDKCVAADSVLNGYLGIAGASNEMGVSGDSAALPASSSAGAAVLAEPAVEQPADAGAAEGDAAPADGAVAEDGMPVDEGAGEGNIVDEGGEGEGQPQ